MFAPAMPLGWRMFLMLVVGAAAGIANRVAGSGTFLTFPAMLALGIAPLPANISTTVRFSPSYVGGMWRFRSQITPQR
jgi:hypothetical protein